MNGVRIQVVRFADGTVIIAQDEINLKRILISLDDILKSNYKMKINRENKEVMVCSKDFENINIKMDDNTLKQVPKFKYLFSTIREDRENKKCIMQRIKEAKVMFNNKKQLLCSNNFSL